MNPRIDGSGGGRQDAGAPPAEHRCQTCVIPLASFICCHAQRANCCYDYSCCLNGGRRGVVSIARLHLEGRLII